VQPNAHENFITNKITFHMSQHMDSPCQSNSSQMVVRPPCRFNTFTLSWPSEDISSCVAAVRGTDCKPLGVRGAPSRPRVGVIGARLVPGVLNKLRSICSINDTFKMHGSQLHLCLATCSFVGHHSPQEEVPMLLIHSAIGSKQMTIFC
jgi:hypothetical protein